MALMPKPSKPVYPQCNVKKLYYMNNYILIIPVVLVLQSPVPVSSAVCWRRRGFVAVFSSQSPSALLPSHDSSAA